jgi:uncharacterized membrane protein
MALAGKRVDETQMSMMETDQVMFEALIVPHRSLTRRGRAVVLLALAALCCVNVGVSIVTRAWPVGGFAGAELLLAAYLLRRNARDARASELVLLSEQSLRIIRTDAKGVRQEQTLSPFWLTMQLQDRPGRVPALLLTAQGRHEEVGRSLGEAEKRDLARALSDALHRWRNPVFDNPQLRE